MTQILKFPALVMALILVIAGTSCRSKDKEVVLPLSEVKKMLIARPWQVNEVSEVQNNQNTVVYKRGAANNEEDYTEVRQLFKEDGSIVYTDQEGETGSDGHYELLDNGNSLKLSITGLEVKVNTVKVTNGEFSYRLGTPDGYVQFNFGPAQ